MKKIICMLLALLLLLSGCGAQERARYTGTMEGYEFYHTTERNRLWEEDILYLAERYLETHPLLVDKELMHTTIAIDPDSLMFQNKYEYSDEFYDEATKNAFLAMINQLIPRVPELTDAQIAYELQKIVVTLGDPHSVVDVGRRASFPIRFDAVYEAQQASYYAVAVPEGCEQVLLGKLIAVNDVPVEEIIERLREYVAYDNDYWLIHKIANSRDVGCFLTQMAALRQIGVAGKEETSAVFAFETASGIEHITLGTVTANEFDAMQLVEHPMLERFAYNAQDDLYWYELINDGKTMYIRLSSMYEDPEYRLSAFRGDVQKVIREAEEPLQIVFDFRNNGGGLIMIEEINSLIKEINRSSTNGVYVLIDSGSFSAGTTTPYRLKKAIDGAQLVGAPAGQFPNIFGNPTAYALPHHKLPFYVSAAYHWVDKDVTMDALYPDVLIRQSLEDYLNGVDAALQYVLDQE